jgi:hypothetical protein
LQAFAGSKVQGFKVAFSSLDCIWDAFLREKVNFIRPNSEFRAKLAIIWENEHFQREFRVFNAFFVLNLER